MLFAYDSLGSYQIRDFQCKPTALQAEEDNALNKICVAWEVLKILFKKTLLFSRIFYN